MSTEEKMTIDERYKYLRRMQKRYKQAGRRERGELLSEMEAVTGLHRKSLNRLVKGQIGREARRRERGRRYGPEVDDALRVIRESTDYICAERLQPNLVWLAEHLSKHEELEMTDSLREQLEQVSISTVRRIVQRIGQDERRLPQRRGVGQRSALGADVPMGTIPWQTAIPGYLETDTVFHSGASASGEFLHTLQMIDVATGWSERVAVLGRSYLVMEDAFSRILRRLPFAIRLVHPDNGSEILNYHLLRFWQQRQGVSLRRSRPYHKNDNRFVEQKNETLVRAYLGHERLDTVAQTLAVNQLYDLLWVYNNFFQPVMRMVEKTVVPAAPNPGESQSAKVQRHFDLARTPFDRLCDTDVILPQHAARLHALRNQINPRHLRQQIYDQIDAIFSLPNAVPGVTEDVYQTLSSSTNARTQDTLLRDLAFDCTPLKA